MQLSLQRYLSGTPSAAFNPDTDLIDPQDPELLTASNAAAAASSSLTVSASAAASVASASATTAIAAPEPPKTPEDVLALLEIDRFRAFGAMWKFSTPIALTEGDLFVQVRKVTFHSGHVALAFSIANQLQQLVSNPHVELRCNGAYRPSFTVCTSQKIQAHSSESFFVALERVTTDLTAQVSCTLRYSFDDTDEQLPLEDLDAIPLEPFEITEADFCRTPFLVDSSTSLDSARFRKLWETMENEAVRKFSVGVPLMQGPCD